jgi:hypothetical protein
VIGTAVTRDGIPVRVWSWPGNTGDRKLIRQVKDDMRDWTLSKIVWVTDRGFSRERNRRYLRQGENAYIVGEKLRSGSPEVKAALSRQGRYGEITGNMRVEEVKLHDLGIRVFTDTTSEPPSGTGEPSHAPDTPDLLRLPSPADGPDRQADPAGR